MTVLHLVRHGPPAPDAGPAERWPLHPEAATPLAALRSSGALPDRARWFASPEPKAFGTARGLTDEAVGLVDGLREMTRPAEAWVDDTDEWRATVRRSMTEPDRPARPHWETARSTTDRVVGAVRRIRESCPDDDLVLVGHGTAWTLLVAALRRRPPDLAAWTALRMPDHCALRLLDGTVDAADDGADVEAEMLAGWGAWSAI